MRTMRKEVDFTTFKGFLGEDLVYDKQENALFSYILYNDDFINKEEVSLTSTPLANSDADKYAAEKEKVIYCSGCYLAGKK